MRWAGSSEDVREVDAADGQIDGRWRENDIQTLLGGFDTPARIPYQTRVLTELIEREGFGADDVPDLLFVNFKMIDYISHVWTVNSPEMQDAVRAQDEQLEVLVDALDRIVGEGEWVARAHGRPRVAPRPRGDRRLPDRGRRRSRASIDARFDTDGDDTRIVELVQPTQIFVDERELRQNGHTLEEVERVDPRPHEGGHRAAGHGRAGGRRRPTRCSRRRSPRRSCRTFRACPRPAHETHRGRRGPRVDRRRVHRLLGRHERARAAAATARPSRPAPRVGRPRPARRPSPSPRRAPSPTPPARSRTSSCCASGAGPTRSARGRSCSSRRSRTSSGRTSRTRVRGTTCRTSRCSGSATGSSPRSAGSTGR